MVNVSQADPKAYGQIPKINQGKPKASAKGVNWVPSSLVSKAVPVVQSRKPARPMIDFDFTASGLDAEFPSGPFGDPADALSRELAFGNVSPDLIAHLDTQQLFPLSSKCSFRSLLAVASFGISPCGAFNG